MTRHLIEGTAHLLIFNDWTQAHKAADALGHSVPIWDTRVRAISLVGAYERAAQILGIENLNQYPLTFELQRMIVTDHRDWFGGWLSAEPLRSLVSYNDKIASSKSDIMQLLEKALNELV